MPADETGVPADQPWFRLAGTSISPARTSGNRVMAVGDVMVSSRVSPIPDDTEPVARLLRSADLAVANLEMVLTDATSSAFKPSTVALQGERAIAGSLAEFGFQAVSLANNHAMDFGVVGLCDSLDALGEHAVSVVGAGLAEEDASAPLIRDVAGTTVAMLGVSCTVPPGSMAEGDSPGVCGVRVATSFDVDPYLMMEQPGTAPRVRTTVVPADLERVTRLVRSAAETADVVVVMMHWGVPSAAMNTFPAGDVLAEYQRPLGHALVDAGADVILGHHPHAVHGYEVYRDKLILYSLGHFAFEAHLDFMSTAGLVADFAVSPDGVSDLRLWPLVGSERGLARFARPDEARTMLADIRRMSAGCGDTRTDLVLVDASAELESGRSV